MFIINSCIPSKSISFKKYFLASEANLLMQGLRILGRDRDHHLSAISGGKFWIFISGLLVKFRSCPLPAQRCLKFKNFPRTGFFNAYYRLIRLIILN